MRIGSMERMMLRERFGSEADAAIDSYGRWMAILGESWYTPLVGFDISDIVKSSYAVASVEPPGDDMDAFGDAFSLMGANHMNRFLDVVGSALDRGFLTDDEFRPATSGGVEKGISESFLQAMYMRPVMHDDIEFLVLVLMGRDDYNECLLSEPVHGFRCEKPRLEGIATMLDGRSFDWVADMLSELIEESARTGLIYRIDGEFGQSGLYSHHDSNGWQFSQALLDMGDRRDAPGDPREFARRLVASWNDLCKSGLTKSIRDMFSSKDVYLRWRNAVACGTMPDCVSDMESIRGISRMYDGTPIMDRIVRMVESGVRPSYDSLKRSLGAKDAFTFGCPPVDNDSESGVILFANKDATSLLEAAADRDAIRSGDPVALANLLGVLTLFDVIDGVIRRISNDTRNHVTIRINGTPISVACTGDDISLDMGVSHGRADVKIVGSTGITTSRCGLPASSLLHGVELLSKGYPRDMIIEDPLMYRRAPCGTGEIELNGKKVTVR